MPTYTPEGNRADIEFRDRRRKWVDEIIARLGPNASYMDTWQAMHDEHQMELTRQMFGQRKSLYRQNHPETNGKQPVADPVNELDLELVSAVRYQEFVYAVVKAGGVAIAQKMLDNFRAFLEMAKEHKAGEDA